MHSSYLSLVGIALFVVVVAPGCVSRDQYLRAQNTIEQQDAVISNYEGQNSASRGQLGELEDQVARLTAELRRARSSEDALQSANQRLASKYEEIRESLGKGGLPAGVNLESRSDGISFQVEGAVLFASGQAEIKGDGENTLLDIIARIRDGNERIRVEGHTDSVPVTNTKHLYPYGNLQLSGARALRVADFCLRNGIAPERIYYAGVGQHDPIADNSTPEGRAANRRVEIVLLMEEEPRN